MFEIWKFVNVSDINNNKYSSHVVNNIILGISVTLPYTIAVYSMSIWWLWNFQYTVGPLKSRHLPRKGKMDDFVKVQKIVFGWTYVSKTILNLFTFQAYSITNILYMFFDIIITYAKHKRIFKFRTLDNISSTWGPKVRARIRSVHDLRGDSKRNAS